VMLVKYCIIKVRCFGAVTCAYFTVFVFVTESTVVVCKQFVPFAFAY